MNCMARRPSLYFVRATITGVFLTAISVGLTSGGEISTKPLLNTPSTHLNQPLRLPAKEPRVKVLTVTVPPGMATNWHTHDALVVGYIVRGAVTVEYDHGERAVLAAGDALVEALDTVHRGVNHGTEPVEILVVHLAEGDAPLSVAAKAPGEMPAQPAAAGKVQRVPRPEG